MPEQARQVKERKMRSVKIAATSDLHGHLPSMDDVPDCDMLIIAGDLGPATMQYHTNGGYWIDQTFRVWLERVKLAKEREIVGIAGNHDFVAEKYPKELYRLPWTYLDNEAADILGLTIWGSPHTPPFYDWAFNTPEDELAEMYASIPADTDILVTHGPPHGVLDQNAQGEHCGGRSLYDAVYRVKPKLHVFGHIHECGHRCQGDITGTKGSDLLVTASPNTMFANVSAVDEHYKPRPSIFREFVLESPDA